MQTTLGDSRPPRNSLNPRIVRYNPPLPPLANSKPFDHRSLHSRTAFLLILSHRHLSSMSHVLALARSKTLPLDFDTVLAPRELRFPILVLHSKLLTVISKSAKWERKSKRETYRQSELSFSHYCSNLEWRNTQSGVHEGLGRLANLKGRSWR